MKTSRIIVLCLAVAAAGGAFMLATGQDASPPSPAAQPPSPPPPPPTEDILVAAKDLPLGHKIIDNDLAWQPWPKDATPPGTIHKAGDPKAIEDEKGAIVRSPVFQGEPIRPEKFIKGNNNGFMSAILPTGRRAVAINIDSQGATSAGSFILPNDRVDVVRTFRPEPKVGAPATGGSENYQTDTLLSNVRVLAIGQNFQDKDGQPVVVGSNATLELDPGQAETVILAQRTGQLSLVLRSIQDARQAPAGTREAGHGLSVVRYGTITQDTGR